MSQNPEYIELLVFKFNNGTITPEEQKMLTEWYNSHDDRYVTIPTKEIESAEEVRSRMLSGLLVKMGSSETKPVKRLHLTRWLSAAAAILVVALITWQFIQYKTVPKSVTAVAKSIEPGGYKATLTLANGKTIALSSAQTGIVTGEKITYLNGTPVTNEDLTSTNSEENILALHTPRGGTYNITLPDGTEVWLNAASTIKYPSRFSAASRIVHLEGEAYFHVKKAYSQDGERIPFKVIANKQEVEVLGTQFNMNAYPEQESAKTTLVTPNHQAVTTKGNTLVKKVNVYNYTAWREGKFSFDGKTFEETMNDIARWYNLRIVYEGKIPDEELVGDAFRNQHISFVQTLLNVAQIDYDLDVARRQLTIKGKKQNVSPKTNRKI
jgi:ferric-dicitrate binding protein FerR (iron transport regulator)